MYFNLQPVIKHIHHKKFIGKQFTMSLAKDNTSALWRNFMPERKIISHTLTSDLYSIQVYSKDYFNFFEPDKLFQKWAAVEVANFDNVPEGMETFTIPGGNYAVFNYKGLNTDKSIYQYIFSTWLPASGFKLDDRPHFEILGEKYRNNDPDSEEEIWIPVCKAGL